MHYFTELPAELCHQIIRDTIEYGGCDNCKGVIYIDLKVVIKLCLISKDLLLLVYDLLDRYYDKYEVTIHLDEENDKCASRLASDTVCLFHQRFHNNQYFLWHVQSLVEMIKPQTPSPYSLSYNDIAMVLSKAAPVIHNRDMRSIHGLENHVRAVRKQRQKAWERDGQVQPNVNMLIRNPIMEGTNLKNLNVARIQIAEDRAHLAVLTDDVKSQDGRISVLEREKKTTVERDSALRHSHDNLSRDLNYSKDQMTRLAELKAEKDAAVEKYNALEKQTVQNHEDLKSKLDEIKKLMSNTPATGNRLIERITVMLILVPTWLTFFFWLVSAR